MYNNLNTSGHVYTCRNNRNNNSSTSSGTYTFHHLVPYLYVSSPGQAQGERRYKYSSPGQAQGEGRGYAGWGRFNGGPRKGARDSDDQEDDTF